MSTALKMEVDPQEIIEDLLAATCPEYLASIREARAEYKADRTASHKDVFGQ